VRAAGEATTADVAAARTGYTSTKALPHLKELERQGRIRPVLAKRPLRCAVGSGQPDSPGDQLLADAGVHATLATRRILGLEAGLRPHLDPAGVRHARYRLGGLRRRAGRPPLWHIDGGVATGRILRVRLTHTDCGEEHQYERVTEIRAVFEPWAAIRGAAVESPG
jgi:hypothetical protein